jgi:2-C-methyl-D-erythritol 4-phosphate cytidylyltransferase
LWDAGCRPIVVAAPPVLVADAQAELGDRAIVVAAAGDRRSTMLGALIRVTGERVAVLDHTYPLATVDEVRAVLDGLDEADACVVAIPVMETLKLVREGVIHETVDRAEMWHQQMPLGFRTATLSAAHRSAAETQDAEAQEEGTKAGDDVRTVERFGGKVVIVPGSRSNIRITTAEDLKLAHALVGRER